jgi:hypothetical protein
MGVQGGREEEAAGRDWQICTGWARVGRFRIFFIYFVSRVGFSIYLFFTINTTYIYSNK